MKVKSLPVSALQKEDAITVKRKMTKGEGRKWELRLSRELGKLRALKNKSSEEASV